MVVFKGHCRYCKEQAETCLDQQLENHDFIENVFEMRPFERSRPLVHHDFSLLSGIYDHANSEMCVF